MSNVACEAGAWHDNLTIGHYGVSTLRPKKDVMKRQGAPDGWISDLHSSNWTFNFEGSGDSSAADTSAGAEENANREFLDVLFPFKVEITEIRLQGIREISIGGHGGLGSEDDFPITAGELDQLQNPLPPKVKENLRGAVKEFEVWCNDGYDWLV